MNPSRHRYALCAIAGVWAALWSMSTARGQLQQTNIPSDTITAESISPDQLRTIQQMIEENVSALESGDFKAIKDARKRLVDPLRFPGKTPAFDKAYQTGICERMSDTVVAEDVVVRMNAMIVVSYLTQPIAIPRVLPGLTDDSPGVRYWASRGAYSVAAEEQLDQQLQQQLLDTLEEAIGREEDEKVLGGLLKATVALEIPQAKRALIEALDERVEIHVNHPESLYDAERVAMNRLLHELIGEQEAGRPIDADTVRKFASAAYRYSLVAAQQLQNDASLPPNVVNDHGQLILLGENILKFCIKALNVAARQPQSWEHAVRIKQWAFVLVELENWKRILTTPQFGLKDADLEIQAEPEPDQEQAAVQ